MSPAEREIAAVLYVATLVPGDRIVWATDHAVLDPIWDDLRPALARRSLRLEPIRHTDGTIRPGWWQVVEDLPDPTRIQCRGCARAWFECACTGHVILGAVPTVMQRGGRA